MSLLPRLLVLASTVVAISGCRRATADSITYTLYRNSVLDSLARYHVATFDVALDNSHNQENCEIARQLFQGQPGVRTRFWCEKGRFKP